MLTREGTATTGRPHCAYFVPAIKIAQMLAAGCDMTVLLADIHGFLDNLKAPIELVRHRAEYYRFIITSILKAVGVPVDRLRIVLGSSHQQTPEYIMDLYKLASVTSEHDAKKAGAEIVKQTSNAPLSGLLYPLLQVLDEQYLDVDAQFGGQFTPIRSMTHAHPSQVWTSVSSSQQQRTGSPRSATESAPTSSTPWSPVSRAAR